LYLFVNRAPDQVAYRTPTTDWDKGQRVSTYENMLPIMRWPPPNWICGTHFFRSVQLLWLQIGRDLQAMSSRTYNFHWLMLFRHLQIFGPFGGTPWPIKKMKQCWQIFFDPVHYRELQWCQHTTYTLILPIPATPHNYFSRFLRGLGGLPTPWG